MTAVQRCPRHDWRLLLNTRGYVRQWYGCAKCRAVATLTRFGYNVLPRESWEKYRVDAQMWNEITANRPEEPVKT